MIIDWYEIYNVNGFDMGVYDKIVKNPTSFDSSEIQDIEQNSSEP